MRPSFYEPYMSSYSFPFFKLSPGGNPTILTDDEHIASLPADTRASIANALLHSDHLHADQVGFLSVKNGTPHMEMMGGEFCVNAVRSAAAVFARKGVLPQTGEKEWQGDIATSGVSGLVRVAVREVSSQSVYESALALPRPSKNIAQQLSSGEILVRLPGITHLLLNVDNHPIPANPLNAAREKRSEYGLEEEEAAGVIWFSEKNGAYSIVPVVHVAATGSAVLESACGSGSLALALHLALEKELLVLQPSGHVLAVSFTAKAAWIRGTVTVTAHGQTYVSL